jgi:hypothetical protein
MRYLGGGIGHKARGDPTLMMPGVQQTESERELEFGPNLGNVDEPEESEQETDDGGDSSEEASEDDLGAEDGEENDVDVPEAHGYGTL